MARILTLNTYLLDVRLFGLLRVYKAAPWLEPRRHALAGALRDVDADVICLQEVFRRPHRQALAAALRDVYPHAAGVIHPGRPLGTGLLVLSRHPIEHAAPAEFRAAFPEEKIAIRMGMLDCLVRLPDLGPTRIIDLHLAAGGLKHHPEAPPAEVMRSRQIRELLARAAGNVPERVILAGDFNAGPHTCPGNYRQVVKGGFRDLTAEAGGDPMTWDPDNPMITGPLNRSLPSQRIDHVFLRRKGAEDLIAGDARVVLDDPRVTLPDGARVPVSDHYGLLAEIRANA